MMNRILLTSVALLALPAAASAQLSETQSCLVESAMTEPDDPSERAATGGTTIIRSGIGHEAHVERNGDGTVRIEQHGRDHVTLAVQSGDGSRLDIAQSGASSQADILQSGACNDTALVQTGSSNRTAVTQSGSGNRVIVNQGKKDD